jgi:hypothetical protein
VYQDVAVRHVQTTVQFVRVAQEYELKTGWMRSQVSHAGIYGADHKVGKFRVKVFGGWFWPESRTLMLCGWKSPYFQHALDLKMPDPMSEDC